MRRHLGFTCFLALACSAPNSTAPRPNSGRVVEVRALPKSHAEVLSLYAKGGREWESARAGILADPNLARFLVENLAVEMVKAHRALGSGDAERARRALDRAQHELVRAGDCAVATLAGFVEVADPVSSTLAVSVLARIGRASVAPIAVLLDSAELETRRRAAAALAELPHAGVTSEPALRARLIELARTDEDWMLRAQCTTTLGARGARDTDVRPWRVALEGRLLDSDAAVAEAAATAGKVLGAARARSALLRSLEAATQAGDMRRFRAVESAVVKLSGEAPKPNLAAWRDWWTANRARIEDTRPL